MEGLCGSFFWDLNVTWYTDTLPRFTNCFENTVLIWVPCLLLWGFTPLQLYYIAKSKSKLILWNLFNKVKLMITALLIGLVIFRAVYSFAFKPPYFLLTDFVTPLVQMSTFVLAIYLMLKNRKAGIRSSGVLFMFWLLLLIGGIPPYVNILRGVHYERYEQVIFITDVIYFPLVVSMCILNSFADSRPLMTYFPQPQNPCPDNDAPFISKILFAWFEPLVWKGYRNPLDFKDLWSLSYENTSAYIVPIFDKYWKRETGKVLKVDDAQIQLKNGVKPGEAVNTETTVPSKTAPSVSSDGQTRFASVILPICLTFLPNFFLGAILKVFMDLLTFASPQILRLLINYVEGDEPFWRGIFYAALLFFVSVIQTLFLSQYFHQMFIAGMRMRSALISTIFRKALCISNVVRRDFTLGEIVNLMSVDTQRLADLTAYINMLWSAPLQIILALIFLWQILGPSVLAGLAVMVILIPVNALIASKMRSLQISQMKNKDNRIKLMNEILSGIKILKLYAWEPSFERQIDRVRKKEIQILKTQAYLNSATSFIWACAPFLVSLVTFAVYVLSSEKNILDAETAFVSLSLFNILRFPLSMLPMLISNIVQASVSVKRINKFLNSPELNPFAVSHDTNEKDPLVIEDGSFTWGEEGSTPFLNNINIRIKSGSLVAVVGSVGSGKSSLISAFLGEIHKVSGYINTKGSLAYVPQQAWIQNATLRSNITFGGTLNQILYDQIISACALQHDLDILPGGDQTEIGEKGINLSGGQKQRISLARAVYNDADVYFLDDPLSAVDSHVGKHIFEHVIGPNGILKNKTRLLVTHSITYLSEMDLIIVLKNGTVSEMGTYRELLDKKGDFADFLLLYLEDNKVENEEDMNKLKELLGSSPQLEEKLMRQISKGSVEGSTTSLNSLKPKAVIEDEPVKVPSVVKGQRLIEEEKRETGNIRWQVYSYYLSSIGLLLVLATIVTMLFFQSFSVLSSMWLSTWSSDKDAVVNNVQDINKRNLYLSVYALLGLGQALLSLYTTFFVCIGVLNASRRLHSAFLNNFFRWPLTTFFITSSGQLLNCFFYDVDVLDSMAYCIRNCLTKLGTLEVVELVLPENAIISVCTVLGSLTLFLGVIRASSSLHILILKRVLRWPMLLFDITPIGRIITRFSYDVDVLDNTLGQNLRQVLNTVGSVCATIFIISYSTPAFLCVIVPIGILYYFIQRFYVATSRQLKRLESISRSPIYSHFGEAVSGVQSIRAYGLQSQFIIESEKRLDYNQMCFYPGIVSNRWLSVRLETIGNLIIFFAAFFGVLGRGTLTPGLVGLSITYALQVTQTLNWLVRMASEVETNIVAVERIKEYSESPQEAPWDIPSKTVPQTWPDKGEIVFQDYKLRYREGLDLVLKGINFRIEGQEKIGIVGRTGAGKSSLTLAIFRIIEAAGGKIIIDGVDISTIGLHALRSRLTIIPQDPILFSGTLRINLDPLEEHSDDSIWHALELSHLKEYVTTLPSGLQFEVTEGGENFSAGQRQLICLARALLRKTKILVLDEATAAVDLETDDFIQSTIRREFSDCTFLTIAHRLNTIMDYDRIIVLDQGQLVEFDTPAALLKSKGSVFYSMASDAGLV